MNTIQTLTDRLAIYLTAYRHYIDVKSKAGLQDGAIFGEALAKDLAEIAFDYKDLVNLNLNIKRNHPAIDLGSPAAGCAIQVTTMGSAAKIAETQRKFFEHRLDRTYSTLKFIVLGDKQRRYESQRIVRSRGAFTFNPDRDIYTLADLFRILVTTSNRTKLEAFCTRLEHELGPKIRPYLLDVDLPGQNLHDLLAAHDVRTIDAVQALKPFGMTREILSDKRSVAEMCDKELIQYVADQFWVSENWLDGSHTHIYSGGPGREKETDWRRSLRGAYDLIHRVATNGEKLGIIVPAGLSLCELDTAEDCVDYNASNYHPFFLFARKANDFSADCFRLLISDALSYRGCREGIFLLFVAAELYEIETRQKTYIDVYEAAPAHLASCWLGDKFLVDLYHSGQLVRNHKDFIYTDGMALKATRDVPSRLAPLLQENMTAFLNGRSSLMPTSILFP